MHRPRLSKAAGILSLLGFISLVLMISMSLSFLALFQLETRNEDDFEEGPGDSYGLIVETSGSRMLYIAFESTGASIKIFNLTIEGPDGENIFDKNLSAPFSDMIRLEEGGKYHIVISMNKGNFEDMRVSATIIGLAMALIPMGSFLLLPITLVLLLTGMIMGIIALTGMIIRNKSSRGYARGSRSEGLR